MTTAVQVWSASVGEIPFQVTVYERAPKGGVLYLRWRRRGSKGPNWGHESLKRKLRDEAGTIDAETERWARGEAERKRLELIGRLPEQMRPREPFTLGDARRVVVDPATGKYPVDTPHRREVLRALDTAILAFGKERLWTDLDRADLRSLWRQRITELYGQGLDGLRGAEVTLTRVLAVAAWLRDEGKIPTTACVAARTWKQHLRDDWRQLTGARADYEPKRPRYTLEEMRKILAAAPQVDPRLELLVALGAELRLGQVLRARRSDLNLEAGAFTVPGIRGKRGVREYLTGGQIAAAGTALTVGYLKALEAASGDFPLFPQGQMPGGRSGAPVAAERHRCAKPIGRRTALDWFHEAEQLAGVPHVEGRGWYGLRRAGVDAAKAAGISREGLKAHGGWTDAQMPDQVYAEQDTERARREAQSIRAKIRGEA